MANKIPADGNARAIGVILVGIELAQKICVGDSLGPIGGDVLIADDEEGVDAFDARYCAGGIGYDVLAQAA